MGAMLVCSLACIYYYYVGLKRSYHIIISYIKILHNYSFISFVFDLGLMARRLNKKTYLDIWVEAI